MKLRRVSVLLIVSGIFFIALSILPGIEVVDAAVTVRTWQGNWAEGRPYTQGDAIEHDGSSFICSATHNSAVDNQPPNAMYWTFLVPGGATGPQGVPGPQGGLGLFPGSSLDKQMVSTIVTGIPSSLEYDQSSMWFSGGQFSILTPTPLTLLTVNGTVRATRFIGDGSNLTWIGYDSGGKANAEDMTIGADSDNNGSGEITLETRTTSRLVVKNDGLTGVGTISPTTALDVNGTINANGFLVNGSAFGTSENSYWSSHGTGNCYVAYLDTILEGNQCVGLDCVVNYQFDENTLVFRENNLRILFLDTSSKPFPSNDWRISGNDSNNGGKSYLAVTDTTAATIPLLIEAGTTETALFIQKTSGNVGVGIATPQGTLDVNGKIYQRGGRLHADYVFAPEFEVETISEHSAYMWQEKHLKAVPAARNSADNSEVTDIGEYRRGILEELEKAHIYIEQLRARNNALSKRIEKAERGVLALAQQRNTGSTSNIRK